MICEALTYSGFKFKIPSKIIVKFKNIVNFMVN